jgi:hypothetical protein
MVACTAIQALMFVRTCPLPWEESVPKGFNTATVSQGLELDKKAARHKAEAK